MYLYLCCRWPPLADRRRCDGDKHLNQLLKPECGERFCWLVEPRGGQLLVMLTAPHRTDTNTYTNTHTHSLTLAHARHCNKLCRRRCRAELRIGTGEFKRSAACSTEWLCTQTLSFHSQAIGEIHMNECRVCTRRVTCVCACACVFVFAVAALTHRSAHTHGVMPVC